MGDYYRRQAEARGEVVCRNCRETFKKGSTTHAEYCGRCCQNPRITGNRVCTKCYTKFNSAFCEALCEKCREANKSSASGGYPSKKAKVDSSSMLSSFNPGQPGPSGLGYVPKGARGKPTQCRRCYKPINRCDLKDLCVYCERKEIAEQQSSSSGSGHGNYGEGQVSAMFRNMSIKKEGSSWSSSGNTTYNHTSSGSVPRRCPTCNLTFPPYKNGRLICPNCDSQVPGGSNNSSSKQGSMFGSSSSSSTFMASWNQPGERPSGRSGPLATSSRKADYDSFDSNKSYGISGNGGGGPGRGSGGSGNGRGDGGGNPTYRGLKPGRKPSRGFMGAISKAFF